MATTPGSVESTTDTSNTGTSTESTTGTEPTGQQTSTEETSGQETPKPVVIDKDTKLPDDHPLVTTLATQKTKLAAQVTELNEARAQAAKATKLEEQLAARPTTEALTALQTRYDRLEEFLQQAGGPLGKALDSRTFTRDLFESDKSVADLVKEWNRANPSATSVALASAAATPGKAKADPNELIRAAWNGGSK